MVSCNSLNVQTPTPKPNPQTLVNVPCNNHYQNLTNLQSEKMGSKANCNFFFYKYVHKKHPFSNGQTNTTHMGFFFGSSKHAQLFIFIPHTITPQGTQLFFKNILELPLISFKEKPPLNSRGQKSKH
jgi:hypothetical protein